jgi:glycosyltransferase involved in cell wall biosynthesis
MVILDGLAFRSRYGAVLDRYARETALTARSLARRVKARRALVVSAYPENPDQSTLWWYDQGILTLLAAAGMELTFATDASYELDESRLFQVGAKLRRITLDEVAAIREGFDFVVAMTPSDVALDAAERLGVSLCAFGVKQIGEVPALTKKPPRGTVLWHGFISDPDYVHANENHLGAGYPEWVLRGAPFPVNRYYFPVLGEAPSVDALLLGTKDRDVGLVFAALRDAGARQITVLADPADIAEVERLAAEHGLSAKVLKPQKQIHYLGVLESAKMVVNPITSKSHYSFVAPLALGVPVVAMDSEGSRVFVHGDSPAVLLAPPGDVAAWSSQIKTLLQPEQRALRSRSALEQIRTRHDLDRFFASALVATLPPA